MLKLGLLNADLDVGGVGAVEEVKLFRLTESEKRDFEKRLPEFSALVADLNLINIDSFKFLRGFSDQLTERVREGSLLLCFTSRPNLHSPDGIQNKYSWLPLFDPEKEVREDLVDKIKSGEGANGVTEAFHGLISSFYATCSFPDGFGSDPYNTLLQGDDGLPVGLAKSIGKGWVLLIPQAEEKSKVLESALKWWDEALQKPADDSPVAASDETDEHVDTEAADMSELQSDAVDLGDLSADTPEGPAPELEEVDLGATAGDEEASADSAGELEIESAPADEPASSEETAAESAASDAAEVADLGDLAASTPESESTPEPAEDMNDLLASPPPDSDEFSDMSSDPVDLDLDSPESDPANFNLDAAGSEPSGLELDTPEDLDAGAPEESAAEASAAEEPAAEDELSAEDRDVIASLKVLLGKDFDEIAALPIEKLREIHNSHVEEARRKVFESGQDELSALLESQEEEDPSVAKSEDEEPTPEKQAAAARASIDDIGMDSPLAPSWIDEFKGEIPGISDIVEEAEKLESEARRLLDQAGELRGRIDALSRWDRLLYLSHADIAEELGEFFHVVLGADVSLEEERDEGRPTLKMLSAEGDFLVHVATDTKPIGEEVGRDLMRHLADADVDTKGMLVLNGSQGRTPPRSPEDHAQKKLVKLASKRGLLIVTVNQLYRLGLKAQQDENWDAEPVLEQFAEQSGLYELPE